MSDHKSFIHKTRDQVAEITTKLRAEIEERQEILDSLEDIEYSLDHLIERFEEEEEDSPEEPAITINTVKIDNPDPVVATTNMERWLSTRLR